MSKGVEGLCNARFGVLSRLAVAVSAVLILSTAHGAEVDASQLGTSLTPLGGEKAGNADGSIPAWSEPGVQFDNWTYGQPRGHQWKFKDDKPLFSITAANVDKYAEKLTPGQVEMFKKISGYSMDVYPTRRSCSAPAIVVENTKKNVGFASMDEAGLALSNAYLPGVAFPIPSDGAQVIQNMKMRYRGVGVDMPQNSSGVSPRKGSEEWLRISAEMIYFYPWAKKEGGQFSDSQKMEGFTYFNYRQPASLAGQAGVMSIRAGEQMSAFYYFPGQRRVRRMPAFSYDAPQIGLDNQYTVDETTVFSGPLDRFDWKLVGKKEIYVPYNAFGAYDTSVNLEEMTQRDFISPKIRRYELHRVWVVEANVRQGMRHQAPKRLIYIDEDSWSPLAAVDYDAQGNIWKTREAQLIPVAETGTCDAIGQYQYNLADGRYLYDMVSFGVKKDHQWIVEGDKNPRLKSDFYTSDNLRSISER